MNPNKIQKLTFIKQSVPLKTLLKKKSYSTEETLALGKTFSSNLGPGSIVCLFGKLGSGKTTFIRGICEGLGTKDLITSPTFTLINEYKSTLPIYHFDFYRIHSELELYELGLDEYLYSAGISLIEWPEIILKDLIGQRFEIKMNWDIESGWETERNILITKNQNNSKNTG